MAKELFGTEDCVGEVQIATDVIATITGVCASEIEGIDSIIGSNFGEFAGRFGSKSRGKGIKVTIKDDQLTLDVSIVMQFGYSVPRLTEKLQTKVSQAVKNMTGLNVKTVNVNVADIAQSSR